MSEVIISVDGIGKNYSLGAQNLDFRDTITRFGKSLLRGIGSRDAGPNDSFWALQDVSFDVLEGDVFGLIGRNGAGKSTLLKVLSRIVHPTKGSATMRGRVASLLEVGTGFHPDLTGRENVFLNGSLLGMRHGEISKKFDEIVDFAGVEQFLDTPVKRYSSGMYVRLAFAVAAHLEPDILIIDEVLAVGDGEFQKKCLGKMKEVSRNAGRTVLFVSHNMTAVQTLCNKAMLLEKGRIVLIDTASNVVKRYLDGGAEQTFERSWDKDGPGNDDARISRVRVYGLESTDSAHADIVEPVAIDVTYYVYKPNMVLNLSLHVYDKNETLVLSSPSISDTEWCAKPHPVGEYQARCVIPANLLNNGVYSFSPMLVENSAYPIGVAEQAVSIEMFDSGQHRTTWLGEWLGAVRPQLSWKTRRAVVENVPICSSQS